MKDGVYLAASITDHMDAKSSADVSRLLKTTRPIVHLFFCSSQPLSEHRVDQLKLDVGMLGLKAPMTVLGAAQLAQFARRYMTIFNRSYSAELSDITDLLRQDGGADDAHESLALRLAILSREHPDTLSLRNGLIERMLLEALERRGGTAKDLAVQVSSLFRLGRVLPDDFLAGALEALRAKGYCSWAAGGWSITEAGQMSRRNEEPTAAKSVLEGRALLREELESATGSKLADDHFNRIWATFQDQISSLFFRRGLEVVQHVASFLDSSGATANATSGSEVIVDRLAEAVGSTSSLPEQQEELKTAVRDIFSQQASRIYDWLGEVCASFIALCTLGLEQSSGAQLRKAIQRTTLLIDTDLLISLFCEAEPNHDALVSLSARWRELGGQLVVADPVVAETAHHAWIAQREFADVRPWLGMGRRDNARHIHNAFVREFARLVDGRKANVSQWSTFIGQYRGRSEDDGSEIRSLAAGDYGLHLMPAPGDTVAEFERAVGAYLESELKTATATEGDGQGPGWIRLDKVRRDAGLLATILTARQSAISAGLNRTYVVLSSSQLMPRADVEFRRELGDPPSVLSLPAAAWMLSLVPGMTIGMSSLHALLFDQRLKDHVSRLEKVALKVVRESREYDLPFAKRKALKRRLDSVINDRARQEGRAPAEVRDEVVSGSRPETTAAVMARALDGIAHASATEEFLKQRIAALEAELAKRDK